MTLLLLVLAVLLESQVNLRLRLRLLHSSLHVLDELGKLSILLVFLL